MKPTAFNAAGSSTSAPRSPEFWERDPPLEDAVINGESFGEPLALLSRAFTLLEPVVKLTASSDDARIGLRNVHDAIDVLKRLGEVADNVAAHVEALTAYGDEMREGGEQQAELAQAADRIRDAIEARLGTPIWGWVEAVRAANDAGDVAAALNLKEVA